MTAKIIGQYAIEDGLLVNKANGLTLKLGKRAKPSPTKPPYYLTTLDGGYISSLYPEANQEPQKGQKRYLLDFDGERLVGVVDLTCQTFAIEPRPKSRASKGGPKSKSSNIVMDFVSKFDTTYPEPMPPQGNWQRSNAQGSTPQNLTQW
ncbi:MAG: hypothetical protein EBT80_09480 [Chitinophagales bacterium]|nr:hypothetical protein [Chitinophagales bacterium]